MNEILNISSCKSGAPIEKEGVRVLALWAKRIGLFLFILNSLASYSFGATKTWTNGGANGRWTTGNNWSGNTVPVANDDIVIPAGFNNATISRTPNLIVNSISIASNGVVFVARNAATTLTINNTNGTSALTINSGCSLTLGDNGAVTAVNLTFQNINTATSINGTLASTTNVTINLGANETLTISGTFSNGGTFIANNGGSTVIYNSTVAQNIVTTSYDNLTFSGAGTKTTAAGTLSVGGDWSVTGGTATLSTNNSSATIAGNIIGTGAITSGSGTISISGDWTNNGTFTCGTGTVNYNGTDQQVLGAAYYRLTMSGSGTKTIQGNVSVNAAGILTLTSGILELGNYNLTINNNAAGAIAGAFSSTSMIATDGTGYFIKNAASVQTLSPIGGGSYYSPATLAITAGGTTGTISLRSVSTSSLGVNFIKKYWDVITSVGGKTITATFQYDPAEGNTASDAWFKGAGSWQTPPPSGTTSFAANSMTMTGTTAITTTSTWWSVGVPQNYYSYQNGSWNSPSTWTSDPSGTTQVGTTIPGNGDIVEILPGRTVTLPGNVASTGLNITIDASGFLDLSTYQFSGGLSTLAGQGTLAISSNPAVFPTPITTNTFINAGGGTTEYRAGSNLPAQATYNNLTINASGSTVIQKIPLLTLNGDLHVKAGTFQINDNTAQRLQLYVKGNVTTDAGASFTVGPGVTNSTTNPVGIIGGTPPFVNYYDQQSHRIVLYGDFTNRGTVRFTNLTNPLYNAFPPTSGATAGFATVYFQGASDNTLLCAGPTDFYSMVVDKGTDQTYKLTLYTSVNYSNFRLFGANNADFDITNATASNPNIKKALWIRTGTLRLQGTTVIPSLSEGTTGSSTYYYIPSNGALVLDGVDVVVQTTADDYREVNAAYGTSGASNAAMGILASGVGSAFGLYGNLETDNGFFTTKESEGIITTNVASGQLIINKGTVDTKQFLSQAGAASSFGQTGGTFILRGRFQRTPTAYTNTNNLATAPLNTVRANDALLTAGSGTFSMNNTTNVFTMSGGTMQIYDVCGAAASLAFQVNSSAANMDVTGGTVQFIPTAGTGGTADVTPHLISTTTPLGNVTISRASGTSAIQLSTALTILNNLAINSGVFNANGLDVTIGGNFNIESGTTYNTGANTTTLNGSGAQTFTVNLAAPLTLNNLTINKPATIAVNMAGSQTTLNVTGNFNLTTGTLNDNGNVLYIAGNVYNSGLHIGTGKISLNGTAIQTIDGNGIFQNLEMNNTNAAAAPISLVANTTVNGTLNLFSNKIFNIGTYNLAIGASGTITATAFGNSCYIHSSGQSGDGGITKTYTSNTAFVFPVGCFSTNRAAAYAYTPATIGFSSSPTTYGSITVTPVGYEHPAAIINNQSLAFYWRTKSTGFTGFAGKVTHSFVYSPTDIQGAIANYVPSLYDRTNYTWNNGIHANINTGTYTISDWTAPANSTNFIDADYTAGDNTTGGGAFGTPRKFYSRTGGLWSNSNTWSFTSNTGTANTGGLVPGLNDIVIIGGNDSVYLATNNTTTNIDVRSCASLQIEKGSALDVGYNPGCNFSMVLSHPNGNGNFRLTTNYNSGATFAFPSGDFSDFNQNLGTTELYTTNPTAGGTYWLPNNVTSYGNLILSPLGGSNIIFGNTNLLIYGNLITRGQNADSWFCPTWGSTNSYPGNINAIAKTITINGNLNIQGGSLIWYQNAAIAQNFVIYGDVNVSTLSALYVYSGGTNQSMSIGGNLINNADGITHAGTTTPDNCDFTNIPVTFFGLNNASITNTIGTPSTTFSKVTVNKGISQVTTLTCNIAGTLTTPTDNWLTLQNGTFQYTRTNPNSDFTISTGTVFNIPATAGLYINYSNTNNHNILLANTASNTNDVYLAGKLTIVNGNVYVGPTNGTTNNNNDIEYASAGLPVLEMDGGSLIVNGQIRRNPSISTGDLTYIQTGGAVTINGNNTTTTNAKLEVLNNGTFTMSNGTLTIIRGGGGTTYGDLFLRPASSSVTGGTIVFNNSSMSGSVQNYLLDASVPLNNLTITGRNSATTANATVKLMVNPLVLNGNLTLTNTQSIFDANTVNNIDVTINGNFTNYGTYNCYNNNTIFGGGAQLLNNYVVTNFYDLTVNAVTSLTINQANNVTVNHNLTLSNGTLICGNNTVNVKGNLTNNANYTDNNTGIVLNGTAQQQVSGTGTFGQLNLNNAAGATVNSNITLNGNLILTNGIFDINKYLLTLGQNSIITASGTGFSSSKMITSDGVWSNVGLSKVFGTSPTTFTYPLGTSGKYTPAVLTITANGTTGSIRVNNINQHHPAVIDPNNVLNYYWEVASTAISGFSGNFVFNYLPTDVVGGPESTYVAAELLTPGTNWIKAATGPSTDNVNETNHTITFNYSGSSNLTGECTAGNDPAIPNTVPQYTSNADGNWSNQSIWTPSGGTSYPCPVGGPNGFIVTINNIVTTDDDYCTAYKTYINGMLKCVSPTYGHNLGTVYGNGTLYLNSPIVPAGRFDAFLDCSGTSTIEYGGTGTYNVNADLYSTVPNLTFSGTGSRILPNKDLTICHQLLINGPTLDNSINNRQLFIEGTMLLTSGAFKSGTGANATVTFAGSSPQTIQSFNGTNAFNNLEINNTTGLTLTGPIDISNSMLLTNGLISTSATNKLTITNFSTSCIIPNGGSSTSYIDGPLTKELNQGDPVFIFPVGKKAYGLGNKLSIRATESSNMLWTVEYFHPNTYPSYAAPLTAINTLEYWKVNSAVSGSTAYINVAWDPLSDLTPLMTQNGVSDMRVAQYNGTNWVQIASNVNAGSDNYNGSVETASGTTLPFTTVDSTYYTLSCLNTVKPKIRISPTGPVCGTAGIPVTLTTSLAIVAPFTVNYTENGTPKSISPASFPATIPTIAGGATYVLTGFNYNYPAGNLQTGVVDANPFTSYAVPTTATVGSNISTCGGSSATLTGNNPAPYTGLWSIISGAGGNVTTPTIYNSNFTGTNGSGYTLRWTISSGACTSSANLNVSFPLLPVQPSSFSASTSIVCQGQNGVIYSVPNDATATSYTWSYTGSGATINNSTTNSVTIDFSASATSGTLSVSTNNGCGISTSLPLSITVNPLPTATISYAGTPFCKSVATAQAVTLTGTGAYTGGTYSSTAGLSINAATGDITPGTSTAGTYTVTYNTPVSGGCAAVPTTTSVTITAVPTATISYAGTPFCKSVATAQAVTLTGTGAYTGGTYSSTAGLTINAATGDITPSTSNAGTYTVTYNTPVSGGCAAVPTTTSVTITAVPTATISYAGTPFCKSVATAQAVTLTGTGAYTGGTYSSTAGLTINAATGDITPGTSTAGTYTVTYNTPVSGGCAAVPTTTSVTITAVPTATISYVGTPFCKSVATAQAVTLTGTGAYTGGTYSSTAGLAINAATGDITPSTSNAGTYTVTYNTPVSGGCAAVPTTTSVTITAVPTATISYAGTPFCKSVATAQAVTLTGTGAYTGGTYSSTAGLSINAATGAITPGTSTAGTYTITYNTPVSGGCAAVPTTTSVTINALPTPTFTVQPGANACAHTDVTYATQTGAGESNYIWSVPGAINTDYTITTGGIGTANNTVTLQWLTTGSKTVTINYNNASGCAATTATSSTATMVTPLPATGPVYRKPNN